MESILFSDIEPFVRHAHIIDTPSEAFDWKVTACDCRLFYGLTGQTEVTVAGELFNLDNGCIFILPAATPYTLRLTNESSSIIAINFDYSTKNRDLNIPIPPERSDLYDFANTLSPVFFTDADELNAPLYLEKMNTAEKDLVNILREVNGQMKHYDSLISARMQIILIEVLRNATFPSKLNTQSGTLKEIIEFIQKNYNTPLKNSDIGKHFGYHPNYINALMVKYTGRSLHKYLIDIRIMKAINLLESTDKSVTNIALLVGMNDTAHFCKIFRKFTGKNPSDYRLG